MDGLRFLIIISVYACVLIANVTADGDKIHGRPCLRSHHCLKPFSHCSRWGRGVTEWECRLNIWVWVVIVLIVIAVISCLCCCLFLPFCFLYKPGQVVREALPFWNKKHDKGEAGQAYV